MKPGMAKVKRIEGVLAPVITPFTRDYAPDAQRGGRREGVAAPVMPPFTRDYAPDAQRFVRHCRWLLKSGCAGLAVFGTNSEANSMSVSEKRRLLEALVKGGVPASALMPGTGHCALSDSIEMTRAAGELGCGGALMLPPLHLKGVSSR